MFENFKKITIKGGYFEDEVELEIFNNNALSIIYGRNGSGKSTIAHCIKQLTENENEEKVEQEKDRNYIVSSECEITDEYKSSVFIFNEDFLQNNVSIKNDGLNTIVMFGEQAELDEKINAKKTELNSVNEMYDQQNELIRKYDNSSYIMSPQYYWSQIKSQLLMDGGWADIDRQLKGNKTKSSITPQVVEQLIAMDEPDESYEELREQVKSDLKLYLESGNVQAIEWTVGELTLPKSLAKLSILLETPLDTPQFSEREQRLISLLNETRRETQHFEQDHTRQMLDEEWTFCPLCLREITKKDRNSIEEVLRRILNKQAMEYDMELRRAYNLFSAVEISMPTFPGDLYSMELQRASVAEKTMNDTLISIQQIIDKRRRNIYEPIKASFNAEVINAYGNAYTSLESATQCLERCVSNFNKAVNKRVDLLNIVKNKNCRMARKQVNHFIKIYKMVKKNETDAKEKLRELDDQRGNLINEIERLKTEKEQTKIALDYINKELERVFYSKRKMKLMPGDGCYKLMVNDKEVKPKNVSVGERNALGLCYFFATLLSKKEFNRKYNDECLIVIDDPISSFDRGNRLGIMSLLQFQLDNIINGNQNNRVLIMSHDLQTVFDLVKITAGLKKEKNSDFFEIENKHIRERNVENEYKKLMACVYEYANCSQLENPDDIMEVSIGNIMRRMLEAFSSFCYNRSPDKMMEIKSITKKIPIDKQNYYNASIHRLILNGASHEKENVYTLNIEVSAFDGNEKRQAARDVLLLLMYINESHIESHLGRDKVEIIKGWG